VTLTRRKRLQGAAWPRSYTYKGNDWTTDSRISGRFFMGPFTQPVVEDAVFGHKPHSRATWPTIPISPCRSNLGRRRPVPSSRYFFHAFGQRLLLVALMLTGVWLFLAGSGNPTVPKTPFRHVTTAKAAPARRLFPPSTHEQSLLRSCCRARWPAASVGSRCYSIQFQRPLRIVSEDATANHRRI